MCPRIFIFIRKQKIKEVGLIQCRKMFKASNHFKNVTFQFPLVKKMYESLLKGVVWPENPFRIMDVGCGSGRILLEILEPLLPSHYSAIVGTDISEDMIDVCRNLRRDQRISFEILDFENGEIPEKFRNSFDFLFSCFVLHYVRDLGKALANCNRLLKPSGQLVFIFLYTSHPLYEVYRMMASYEEWRPYTEDFENYVPLLVSNDPIQELTVKFEECGLEVLQCEMNHEPYDSAAENFLALFTSVDSIHSKIPDEKKRKYEETFNKIFSDIAGFSVEERDLKKEVQMFFPSIVVHAKKVSDKL